MHPKILREFQRLAKELNTKGPYLEIGAIRGGTVTSEDWFSKEERHALSLNGSSQLETGQVEDLEVEATEIEDAEGEATDSEGGQVEVIQVAARQDEGIAFHRGSAHDMRALFEDKCFSTVISGTVLQHDRHFWLSLEEMKRVLAPGGILMVAVPAFTKPKPRIKIINAKGNPIRSGAPTCGIQAPPDYWRFSPQAVKEVIFDGFDIKEFRTFMMPPRIIGVGVKPS
jgi:SAM-dependent methyltransferase